jgi:hypothetical protein
MVYPTRFLNKAKLRRSATALHTVDWYCRAIALSIGAMNALKSVTSLLGSRPLVMVGAQHVLYDRAWVPN